jgi:hypothetical protein
MHDGENGEQGEENEEEHEYSADDPYPEEYKENIPSSVSEQVSLNEQWLLSDLRDCFEIFWRMKGNEGVMSCNYG